MIRTSIDGIKRSGRATQGVIVMRLREGEQVSSLAPVIGSDDDPEPEGAETAIDPAAEAPPDPDVSDRSRTRAARHHARCPTSVGTCLPPVADAGVS